MLVAGLLAGPLFTASYLVQGFVRDGYDPVRRPVSELALGPHGWLQAATFVVGGLLVLLFAAGLRHGPGRPVVPGLVAVWGVGLIGAGVFVTDRIGGPVTWHGQLHDLAFSLPGFAGLALAMVAATVVFARRRHGRFALFSAMSAVAFAVLFVAATTGFAGEDPSAGLWQRLGVSVGWLWLALLAVVTRRAAGARPGRRPRS